MKLRKLELIKNICAVTRCKRKQPERPGFTKQELTHINAWVTIMQGIAREPITEEQVREVQDARQKSSRTV